LNREPESIPPRTNGTNLSHFGKFAKRESNICRRRDGCAHLDPVHCHDTKSRTAVTETRPEFSRISKRISRSARRDAELAVPSLAAIQSRPPLALAGTAAAGPLVHLGAGLWSSRLLAVACSGWFVRTIAGLPTAVTGGGAERRYPAFGCLVEELKARLRRCRIFFIGPRRQKRNTAHIKNSIYFQCMIKRCSGTS
jgi:hypothetical protein